MRLTRADRSVLSDWWFTVDRLMFFALLLLMGAGLVLSLAASPPIAAKYDLEPFYFVRRHAALLLPSVAIMFAASTLTPKQIRRASLVIFLVGIALDGAHPRARARDQGRQALAPARRRLDPAVRIREAGLHRAHRLAVQREPEAPRHPGHPARRRALRHLRGAARHAARFRPDAARHAGVGRAVLHGRHQYGVDRRARRRGRRRYRLGLFPRAARRLAHRPLPRSGFGRHLSGRPLARIPSCMAAGSAGARARAR